MKNWKQTVSRAFARGIECLKRGARKVALVAGGVVALGASATTSHAAIDTDLTALVTDVTSYFDDIKVVVISVVVFGIAIAYAKLLKRK